MKGKEMFKEIQEYSAQQLDFVLWADHFISRIDLQLVFIFRRGMKVYGIQ